MSRRPPAPEHLVWEVKAPGWWPPPSLAVTGGFALAFVAFAIYSIHGGEGSVSIAGSPRRVPPLVVPIVLFLVGEGYRAVRWRNTSWALTSVGHLLRIDGVLLRRVRDAVRADRAEASFFSGLDTRSAEALVVAARHGAAPDRFAAPSGSWRRSACFLAAALLSSGGVELFTWRHRVHRAEFFAAMSSTHTALEKAHAAVKTRYNALDLAWILPRQFSVEPGLPDDHWCEWTVVLRDIHQTVSGRSERVRVSLRLVRPGGWPHPVEPLLITVDDAPDNELYLDQLLPLLDAAELEYEVRRGARRITVDTSD